MTNETDITATVTALNAAATPGETVEYRQLPQNIEAEQALLGAVLVNNEALNKVSDFLESEQFFEPVHSRIYAAARKLIERGQIANPVTLKQYFEQDSALSEVGGAQYLNRLAASAVTVINAEHYGRSIRDLALRRSLIDVGEGMVNEAFDSDIDSAANEQLEAAEQALYNLAKKGSAEGGLRAFRVAVTEAVQMADVALKRDSHIAGVATGLSELDSMLGGMHPSDLLILAGRPAMGKSSLATNIAFHAASRFKNVHDEEGNPEDSEGAIVGFFSLEMSAEQLATRILAEQAEIRSDRIRRGAIKQDDFYRVADAARRLEELPLYIDDTPALSISALRTRARRLQRTHGLGLVVVDYLQLLRPTNTRADNRVQEISEITQALKALAKELNIPVLALSQLSRAVEQREDKRPMLSDLRESGSIEQDADVVMFIFREDYYHERQEPEQNTEKHLKWQERGEQILGKADVIIGKQRHGPTGIVTLSFQREYTKFGNLERAGYGADDFA